MNLDDFFGSKPNVIDLRAVNRWEAIDELIEHFVAHLKIKIEDKDSITKSVKQRESAMSTGIGYGIGIPHASTNAVSDVIAAIGRSQKGIQFDALDGKPVHLVMLFLVPEGQFEKHVDTLANVAKLLHNDKFRSGLWDRFK